MNMQEITLELPHTSLQALQFGDGKHTVLALHGWMDNAMSFAPLAPYLLDDDMRLIAIEFAGHGRSKHRPINSGYHFSDHMRDVMFAVEALGIKEIDIIGHSLGAIAISMLAGVYPERFRRLVCIECYGPPFVSDHHSLPQEMAERLLKLDYTRNRSYKTYPQLEQLVQARIQAGKMKAESAALLMRRNVEETENGYRFISDRRLSLGQPLLMSEGQVQEFLARIQAPVLMIEGQQGFVPHWPHLKGRYDKTPSLQLVSLPGGHHLHMDEPQSVAHAIREFWART